MPFFKRSTLKKNLVKIGVLVGVCLVVSHFSKTVLSEDGERRSLISYADEVVAQIGDSLLFETGLTQHIVDSVGAKVALGCLENSVDYFDTLLFRRVALSVLERNSRIDGAFILLLKKKDGANVRLEAAAYWERKKDSVEVTNCTRDNCLLWNSESLIWETVSKDGGLSSWIAPHFNLLIKKRVVTYACEIKLSDSLFCYVGADYTVSKVYSMLNGWKAGRIGYPYLMNNSEEFIAHPNSDTRTLGEIGRAYGEETLVKLSENIEDTARINPTDYYHLNTVSKAMCWENVVRLDSLGWLLGVSITDQQVYSNPQYFNQQRKNCMQSSFAYLGGLLIFEILVILLLFRKEEVASLVGGTVLIIFIVEIVLLCHISIRYPSIDFSDMEIAKSASQKSKLLREGVENNKDTQKISTNFDRWNFSMLLDEDGAKDYVNLYRRGLVGKTDLQTFLVPVGVYVLTVKFTDSYTTTLSGYVWQIIPYGQNIQPGILFPDAENSNFDHKDSAFVVGGNHEKSIFYRWHFSTEIREPFDYKRFPFDYNALWIRIWPADMDKNVILIPDFKSYNLIHPSFKPGLDNDVIIPGWEIDGTYYSFKEKSYSTSFDSNQSNFKDGFPELHYNIILRRDYFDTIITRIIPIAVLLFMTYSILWISKREDALDVAIACAGLLFVAVFEHVNLRKNMDATGVIYMEYYYFATYMLLVLASVNAILDSRLSRYLPEYLGFSKLMVIVYWPLLLLIVLVATIITFY